MFATSVLPAICTNTAVIKNRFGKIINCSSYGCKKVYDYVTSVPQILDELDQHLGDLYELGACRQLSYVMLYIGDILCS